MKCKFEHDGHCCNCGATQYMIECKQPCETIVTMTNADRIRAMSDAELAHFMAERSVNEYTVNLLDKDAVLTAVQIEALKHNIYCGLMQWLKQPAEGDVNNA